MLEDVCDEIVFSANSNQVKKIASKHKIITDKSEYNGHGPISGLLSVAADFPNKKLLLIACDYPFLKKEDILYIIQNFTDQQIACGIINPETAEIEPLLCLYSPEAISKLKQEFAAGHDSLRRFLQSNDANAITSISNKAYLSIDTPDAFQRIVTSS
jgi:molybdopterin-guanine dinucleotide biosynthesis protein A